MFKVITNFKVKFGATRLVFLFGRHAFKIPRPTTWRSFLNGLLSNMQERDFGRLGWPELCPVVASLPGGWLIVMPRADPVRDKEWAQFNPEVFCENGERTLPVEYKQDSFGILNGKVVAVDYGS